MKQKILKNKIKKGKRIFKKLEENDLKNIKK